MAATTPFAPVTLFRSGDAVVTDLGSTIRFERRAFTEAGLGLGAVIVGLVFWVASRGWPSFATIATLGPDSFETWTAWVLWLCGGLLLIKGLARTIAPPWELSSELRCWKRGARRISFDEVRGVNVTETQIGSVTAVALRLDLAQRGIWLVPGQMAGRREELQRVAERVRAQLQLGEASAPRAPVALSPARFLFAFALALGALWTSLAWIAPDLVVTYPGASHGLRVWPLGPWIAALGLGELAGLALFETLLGPWNRRRVILFVAWFGSYCAVAFVRV
jgi:hypothetical protein